MAQRELHDVTNISIFSYCSNCVSVELCDVTDISIFSDCSNCVGVELCDATDISIFTDYSNCCHARDISLSLETSPWDNRTGLAGR